MRGEQVSASSLSETTIGSSPHARGAGVVVLRYVGDVGIIPACAGSSSQSPGNGSGMKDHPRMRGEQTTLGVISTAWGGSSPHARGAGNRIIRYKRWLGIIPACAGSSSCRSRTYHGDKDHPRMRGEQPGTLKTIGSNMGSSPHARGAEQSQAVIDRGLGIIPACAGSSRMKSWKS